jgi:hydrogenase 3 maturation protease
LLNKLVSFLEKATVLVVIGMGNELRADDAVGLHVIRLLKPFRNDRFKVFEGHMTPEVYIGPACASHPTHVLIVDAAELHQTPGSWQVLLPADVEQGFFTTHTIPALEVAAEIQRRCGASVIFLGIEPKSRDISLGLSKECKQASEELARIIRETVS